MKARAVSARRVALDLPVLLQALLCSDAKSQALRQAWQGADCLPLVSAETAQSLISALSFPGLQLSGAQQQELLADFLPYAEVVQPLVTRRRPRAASPSLQLALSEQARASTWVSDCPKERGRCQRAWLRRQPDAVRSLSSDEFLASLSAPGQDVTS